jgi:hypothetical protein
MTPPDGVWSNIDNTPHEISSNFKVSKESKKSVYPSGQQWHLGNRLKSKICQNQSCGRTFIGTGHQKYCSGDCGLKIKKAILNKICIVCKNSFTTTKETQKSCSRECMTKVKNHNKNSREITKRIKLKIGHCESCGFNKIPALHTHHVDQISRDSKNLMVLCANCHTLYHSVVGSNTKSENKSKEFVLQTIRIAL